MGRLQWEPNQVFAVDTELHLTVKFVVVEGLLLDACGQISADHVEDGAAEAPHQEVLRLLVIAARFLLARNLLPSSMWHHKLCMKL